MHPQVSLSIYINGTCNANSNHALGCQVSHKNCILIEIVYIAGF
jgi:hypothetical protein